MKLTRIYDKFHGSGGLILPKTANFMEGVVAVKL